MNDPDLLAEVRRELGGTATPSAAQVALNAVLRAVRAGLLEDGEVRLARFGSFRYKRVRARRLLLPRTGQEMVLPERAVVRFHPSPGLSREHRRVGHTIGFQNDRK